MTISMYSASIPVFKQMLTSLHDVLVKAEAHCTAKNIDQDALLQARLFPDMFPLLRQVLVAADFANSIVARLANVALPAHEDNERTFAELQARITATLTFLDSLASTQIDGCETREILLRAGTPKEKKLSGQAYLLSYGLPQFFFHVTTAYAILRHNGIDIGKKDYMGAY